MDILLSEQYIIMQVTPDGDYELCFNEDNDQMVFNSLKDAKDILKIEQGNFDYPLVIVRENQTIVG